MEDPFLIGAIDEFYLLQSVLSEAQVQVLYNQGAAYVRSITSEDSSTPGTPLYIYYSFDIDTVSGSSLMNLGPEGSAYNAQLYGSPIITTTDYMSVLSDAQIRLLHRQGSARLPPSSDYPSGTVSPAIDPSYDSEVLENIPDLFKGVLLILALCLVFFCFYRFIYKRTYAINTRSDKTNDSGSMAANATGRHIDFQHVEVEKNTVEVDNFGRVLAGNVVTGEVI
eukprot:gene36395-biopygen4135